MPSMKSYAFLLLTVTLTSAHKVDYPTIDDQEEGEGRIFFSSNGGISFTNSTVDLNALLTAALLALLFAVTLGPSLFGGSGGSNAGYGYGYGGSSQGSGYNAHNFYARSDKEAFEGDLANQMYQLALSFKKYEIQDVECQLFISCEANRVVEADVQGGNVLAEIAFGVKPHMRRLAKHGRQAVERKDAYVAQLLDAFMTTGECNAFKDKCFNANRNKDKY